MYLVSKAVADFCEGPEWLLQLDAINYHKQIQSMGYQLQDISAYVDQNSFKANYLNEVDGFRDKIRKSNSLRQVFNLIIQIVTLNGWLLPAYKDTSAFYMNVHPIQLYRVGKVVLFDDKDKRGIMVERSFVELFKMLVLYMKTVGIICFKYNSSKRQYKKMFCKLQSDSYWKQILGIKKE